MPRLPYFPLYAGDWLGSTKIALLSPAQEGAYIRLLCYAWNDPNCTIPADDPTLAVLSRMGDSWVTDGGPIIACFEPYPPIRGRLHNPRLSEEREKALKLYSSRSEGGKKGAISRWGETPDPAEAQQERPVPVSSQIQAVIASEAAHDEARTVAGILVGIWNEGRAAENHARVTPSRVAKVKARLEDGFTATQLSTAMRALKASPFHNGQNDRGWKAPGPEWVLHKTERVEEFLNGHGRRPAAARHICRNCNGTAMIGENPCPGCPEGRARRVRNEETRQEEETEL